MGLHGGTARGNYSLILTNMCAAGLDSWRETNEDKLDSREARNGVKIEGGDSQKELEDLYKLLKRFTPRYLCPIPSSIVSTSKPQDSKMNKH